MADENEDQWLYGDSVDGKDYTPTNIQSETQPDDPALIEAREKPPTSEEQTLELANEVLSEVRAMYNLFRFSRDILCDKYNINIF